MIVHELDGYWRWLLLASDGVLDARPDELEGDLHVMTSTTLDDLMHDLPPVAGGGR